MRSTSSKNAKENFYSKRTNIDNQYTNNAYNLKNSKGPLRIPNINDMNDGYNNPKNLQVFLLKKDANGLAPQNQNGPIKINNGINNSYKIKESNNQINLISNNNSGFRNNARNSKPSSLPMIGNNNSTNNNYNYSQNNLIMNNGKENNFNHTRFYSSASDNSNGNVHLTSSNNFNKNNSMQNLSGSKTPYGVENSHIKINVNNYKPTANNKIYNTINTNLNSNNYAIENKEPGAYNNIIGGSPEKNRIPSSKNLTNANSSYYNTNNENNLINTSKIANSSQGRPLSRKNSNSNINIKKQDSFDTKNNNYNYNNYSSTNTNTNTNQHTTSNNTYSINNNNSNLNSNKSQNIIQKNNKLDISRKLVGFKNLGNTCFMNTSLQCILHCEAFITRFIEYCEFKKPSRPTPISNSLLNLLENYSKATDKSSTSPEELKTAIARKHRIYSGFSQQDSQEFIRKLLDEISQELNIVTEKKPYRILNENNEQENKIELNFEYDKIFRERENSIIVDTFYGQSISIFKCFDCNYESYSFEKFLDIPLLLDETYNDQDLSKLLGKFFESENIQWESPCPNKKCKKKSMHKKTLKLSVLPDILILSLQRYNNRLRRKNNCRVNFREEIDLKDYTDFSCLQGM